MSIKPISQSFELSDGRSVTIETGKLAKQADGSVVVKMGKTMLMATVVAAPEAREDVDFLPLSVDYKEKYAAAGKFPGGFFKREARPSEYEILICRLIDRALRPLFPDDFHAETQMLVQLISVEEDVSPDALAALAASSALMVSDIPFNGPISEVRVARVNGEFVINPSISQQEEADIELIVAASLENIMMVEGEMEEVSEAEMLSAIQVAHEAIKIQCQAQIDLAAKVEKASTKREYCHEVNDDDLRKQVKEATYQKCYDISKAGNADKHFRSSSFRAVRDEFLETFDEEKRNEVKNLVKRYFHDVEKEAVRDAMIAENIRLDGRKMDEIRPIWTEVDYLPSAHGSAIFTRGETQSLVSVTLGSKLDEQKIDGAVISGKRNFLLHYNFPPFSTGEVKRMMGVSRREVGHGNLAERALKYVIPKGEDNPYTIRVVSDILESNGSSSMASVCGGTLALMDAGINISKPVAGIAMGLISDYNSDKYVVLSDILGDEDHLGDMDFKVTGTMDGITACQMDIKVDGLSYEILEQALDQARNGRIHILNEMAKTLDAPRKDYKDNAPRIEKMVIEKEFIGAVIGPGGKVIQEIQAETGATIVIEEVDEKGVIDIMADNKATIEAAKDWIKGIVAVPEVNEVYLGTVKSIVAFGAFVEILPGKDGLLHISEIDHKRINNVEDVLKQGDKIKVKLIEVDRRSGKLKLSRKALIPKPERKEEN
ncbi:MAG: polyribonucleotide nucleotidyltransferase [Lentimicrobiaceae bacterium]|jgi:polyribonucleotide nucleotidyltransferase|nr:polyribonucleotide nucleotidyltransferase [Lentimicrobiaceae bacterium]MCP4909294.1 polyribonucleotide nucleotidyltransferase [Bacteroidota bacterium]MBT3453551.1 polyribonucleotide nucleotidyltransferase [Lentimicrobiaceae bacterium]MBT3818892.1 polyribonucleotide nucleotidyltransferase [Lentimicrobiaceae bacterium]MBT4060415.1 polyribonucleotide nucleotidyltransferase [Lentimicrobiaceae bacterium]